LPLAAVAYRLATASPERRRAVILFTLFAGMLLFALLSAGFWFFGETFVQLNLYRFSIYPKLLSCIAIAWLLWDRRPASRPILCGLLVVLAGACGLVLTVRPQLHNAHVAFFFLAVGLAALAAQAGVRRELAACLFLGIGFTFLAYAGGRGQLPWGVHVEGLGGDDAAYRSLADWARANTPADAVFLVPPDEEALRPHARRAIVVNFKGVPQLSAELPEWRDRLLAVLDFKSTQELLALPRPMGRTLGALRARYESLPPEHLCSVARQYNARYVVLTRRPNTAPAGTVLAFDSNGRYFVYHLREGEQGAERAPHPQPLTSTP
jgi:hypothetical protein